MWLLPRGAEIYSASKTDRANDTHHNALSVAKRCCAWLVKQRHLRENPFEDVEPDGKRRKGSRKDKLRVDEARAIQLACHRERGIDGALVLSYLLLGARASEIVLRCVRDLDDQGRLLWIDETKTEAGSRRLLIPEELRPLLLELAEGRASNDRLFRNLSDDPMTRRVAYQRVCAFTKRVIGRKLGPQGFRRTQSTLATDAGATGPMVSAHLGHVTAGDMAEITKRSYADPSAVDGARINRGLVVLNGGNAVGNKPGNGSGEASKESA
jgi:integrase